MAEETKKPEAPVAEVNKIKMVRAKVLQPIYLGGKLIDPVKESVVMMSEDDAKEFCDKEFEGQFAFSGQRVDADGDVTRRKIKRAARL